MALLSTKQLIKGQVYRVCDNPVIFKFIPDCYQYKPNTEEVNNKLPLDLSLIKCDDLVNEAIFDNLIDIDSYSEDILQIDEVMNELFELLPEIEAKPEHDLNLLERLLIADICDDLIVEVNKIKEEALRDL
jgi:hypothetical protein